MFKQKFPQIKNVYRLICRILIGDRLKNTNHIHTFIQVIHRRFNALQRKLSHLLGQKQLMG